MNLLCTAKRLFHHAGSHTKRPQSAPLTRKPALLRAADLHSASLTSFTKRTASCINKSGDCQLTREGPRNLRPHSATKQRPRSASAQRFGGLHACDRENTQAQNLRTPVANAGKLHSGDLQNAMDGRASANRLDLKPREGRNTFFVCKERALRSQSMGGKPQVLGRRVHLQLDNQNRASFFYGAPVGRIQYPDIDITTY